MSEGEEGEENATLNRIKEEVDYSESRADTRKILELVLEKPPLENGIIKEAIYEIVDERRDYDSLSVKAIRLLLENKFDRNLDTIDMKIKIRELLTTAILERNRRELANASTAPVVEVLSQECVNICSQATKASDISNPDGSKVDIDTRRDKSRGIPLVIPKNLNTSSYFPMLVELRTKAMLDISGDTGAIGRVRMVSKDNTQATITPIVPNPADKSTQWFSRAGARYRDAFMQLDIKGVKFLGKMRPLNVTCLAVAVTNKEAKVQAVFNNFLRGKFESADGPARKNDMEDDEHSCEEDDAPVENRKKKQKTKK